MRHFFTLIFLLFLLLFTRNAFAATVEFSNAPGMFQKEQEATIDVKIAGAASYTSNYLRAAFYPDSTTSYFGYSFNHLNEWYNGSTPIDPKKFLQIQISPEGTWSGQMKIKPDITSAFFKGNGAYLLKVGRYTANGTSVTDWSSSTEVSIFGVDPTSTPTSTSTPTHTPIPTATKTPTPSTTLRASLSPTFKASPTLSLTPSKIPTPSKKTTQKRTSPSFPRSSVLGSSTKKNSTPTKEPVLVKGVTSSSFPSPSFFILGGLGIITIACGILLFREWRKQKEEEI